MQGHIFISEETIKVIKSHSCMNFYVCYIFFIFLFRRFCNGISQHSSLDHIYLEFLPQLYQNVSKQVSI